MISAVFSVFLVDAVDAGGRMEGCMLLCVFVCMFFLWLCALCVFLYVYLFVVMCLLRVHVCAYLV